jgi:valyl-tRNA synthetase
LGACRVELVEGPPDHGHTRLVGGRLEGFVPLEGLADVDAERARLEKAVSAAEAEVARAETKLQNADFVGRAPASVVEKERTKLAQAEELAARLHAQLTAL